MLDVGIGMGYVPTALGRARDSELTIDVRGKPRGGATSCGSRSTRKEER